jgi:hypothetical protein
MHQEAFDETAHLVLRVPSLNISGRLHQRRRWRKMPRLWSGAFLLGRDRTRPGLRGWTNHDDSPSVRGDSMKAPGPFGGAVGKTLRCGQRHTLHAEAIELCRFVSEADLGG